MNLEWIISGSVHLITLIVLFVTKFNHLKHLTDEFKELKEDFKKHKDEIWEKVDEVHEKVTAIDARCEERHK